MEEAHFNIDFSTKEERSGRMRIWVERNIIKEPYRPWDKILSRHLDAETLTEEDAYELLKIWHQSRSMHKVNGGFIIRVIFAVPTCFITIGLTYWGIGQIFNWITRIDSFPVILLSLILFGVVGWAIFMLFSVNFVALISRISPNPKMAIRIVSVISTLFCLYSIISIWTTPIKYTATMIFCGIVFTLMSLKLAFNLVDGAKHVNASRLT